LSRPENSGLKPGAKLEQRRDAAVDLDLAIGRREDLGGKLERRALAGAVLAHEAENVAPCRLRS
jgi:hypothetical protein